MNRIIDYCMNSWWNCLIHICIPMCYFGWLEYWIWMQVLMEESVKTTLGESAQNYGSFKGRAHQHESPPARVTRVTLWFLYEGKLGEAHVVFPSEFCMGGVCLAHCRSYQLTRVACVSNPESPIFSILQPYLFCLDIHHFAWLNVSESCLRKLPKTLRNSLNVCMLYETLVGYNNLYVLWGTYVRSSTIERT